MVETFSRKMLSEVLRGQIMPRIESKSAPMVLAHPLAKNHRVRIEPHQAPLLPAVRKGRRYPLVSHWVEQGYNSAGFPCLMWVIHGAADIRFAVTSRMAAQNKKIPRQYGYYLAMLPAGSLFLVPTGMPISDGSRPHWERDDPRHAESTLLWFNLIPAGVSLHCCSTKGSEHTMTRGFFLAEPRLLRLAEAAIEELQGQSPQGHNLAHHYLMALLLHMDRVLEGPRVPLEEESLTPPGHESLKSSNSPVERICQFIDINFSQKISLDQMAGHVHISTGHLCRLFQAELQKTPGEFLAERRLQHARFLLETTSLPIHRIGVLCGYRSPEHFNRTFRLGAGVTPGQYRRQTTRGIPPG